MPPSRVPDDSTVSPEPTPRAPDYGYSDSAIGFAHAYLWQPLRSILIREAPPPRRLFEIGCGNGATAHMLAQLGYDVSGIDASESGIRAANKAYPELRLEVGSAYDDLAARHGTFDVVVSLEVIEHLYAPRLFARVICDLMRPGALGVLSAPYHGYWKNLAIALANGFDRHLDPLWDGGHIKFWSRATLTRLLGEFGFTDLAFVRAGRVPLLAKSLIASCRTPPTAQACGSTRA